MKRLWSADQLGGQCSLQQVDFAVLHGDPNNFRSRLPDRVLPLVGLLS